MEASLRPGPGPPPACAEGLRVRGWAEQLSGGGGRPGLGPRWVTDEAQGLRCWLPPAARHTLHGHPVPPLDGDERLRSVSCVLIAERAAMAPISIRGTLQTPRSGAGLCLSGPPSACPSDPARRKVLEQELSA